MFRIIDPFTLESSSKNQGSKNTQKCNLKPYKFDRTGAFHKKSEACTRETVSYVTKVRKKCVADFSTTAFCNVKSLMQVVLRYSASKACRLYHSVQPMIETVHGLFLLLSTTLRINVRTDGTIG